MNILWLTLGDERIASSRVRAHGVSGALNDLGVTSRCVSASRLRLFGALLSALKGADVIVLQKILPNRLVLRLLRRRARVLVWECDDALHLGYPGSNEGARRRTARGVASVLSRVDVVTTSNPLLADELRPPSGVSIWFPGPAPEPRVGVPTPRERLLVWVGSPSTETNLDLVRDVAHELKREGWSCIAVGTQRDDLGWTPVAWSIDTQREFLARACVGVLPQTSSPWNDRKAAYKLFEYSAAGVVPVASDVLPARLLMEGGPLEPFLVRGDGAEWLRAIKAAAERREALQDSLLDLCRRHSPSSAADSWLAGVGAVV